MPSHPYLLRQTRMRCVNSYKCLFVTLFSLALKFSGILLCPEKASFQLCSSRLSKDFQTILKRRPSLCHDSIAGKVSIPSSSSNLPALEHSKFVNAASRQSIGFRLFVSSRSLDLLSFLKLYTLSAYLCDYDSTPIFGGLK